MHARRASAIPKHSQLVYSRAAATHLAQIGALGVALVTALLTLSVALAALALVLAEALLLLVVARSTPFQGSVDRALEREQRAAAAAARVSLLSRMSGAHVTELTEIERLAGEIRARWADTPIESAELGVERVLGIERLLVTYVRLAIAHRRSAEAFSGERWAALGGQALRVGAGRSDGACAGQYRTTEAALWAARRRSVIALRRETWLRANEEREAIGNALATIADVIRWVHELSFVPSDDSGRAAIDPTLSSCMAALAGVRRLEEDVSIDARFFQLATTNELRDTDGAGAPKDSVVPPTEAGCVALDGAPRRVGVFEEEEETRPLRSAGEPVLDVRVDQRAV